MNERLIREYETRQAGGSSVEEESSAREWLMTKPSEQCSPLALTSAHVTSGLQYGAPCQLFTRSIQHRESRARRSRSTTLPSTADGGMMTLGTYYDAHRPMLEDLTTTQIVSEWNRYVTAWEVENG